MTSPGLSEVRILVGDAEATLRGLPDASHQMCCTSPPYYGLRDYGVDGQIGLEHSPAEFIAKLVQVFREVRRVLRPDGTLWLNMGDSYAGSWGAQSRRVTPEKSGWRNSISNHPKLAKTGSLKRFGGAKAKDMLLMPERLLIALQDDGWWVRDKVVWHKPSPMPSSVRDRFCPAWEPVFVLSKSAKYFFDYAAAREPRVGDEDANGFRGGSYVRGVPGPRQQVGNVKVPSGWDTAPGPKGNIHRQGRGNRPGSGNKTPRSMADVGAASGGDSRRSVPWQDTDGLKLMRNVWTIASEPFKEAHFATFPTELARRCIVVGSRMGDAVLDPFGGAGTVGLVARNLRRGATLIELNPEYAALARRRIGLFAEVA